MWSFLYWYPMTKYVNILWPAQLSKPIFSNWPMHNALNHTWMKDPFKAQARSTDLNITKYECSLIQFKSPFYKPSFCVLAVHSSTNGIPWKKWQVQLAAQITTQVSFLETTITWTSVCSRWTLRVLFI